MLKITIFVLGPHRPGNGVTDNRRVIIVLVAIFLTGASLMRPAGWKRLVSYVALVPFRDRLKLRPMSYMEQLPAGGRVMLDNLVPALAVEEMFAVVQQMSNRQPR